MANKVRYILRWHGAHYYGWRVPSLFNDIVEQVRMNKPKDAPRHVQLVKTFTHVPTDARPKDALLMVFREPTGVKHGRSKYIQKLKELGLFREKKRAAVPVPIPPVFRVATPRRLNAAP